MKLTRNVMSGLLLAGVVMVGAQGAMMSMKSNPMVGGMPMMANKNIVQNAVESADHTTLVAAVKAANLVDALMGKGPSRFLHRPTLRSRSFLKERSRTF